jgi:hypothetical protein
VKTISAAVKKSLHLYSVDLTVNALVELRFLSSRTFRDPDGQTSQAALTFQAIVEEIDA